VNRLDKGAGVFWWHIQMNAVTQVKYVPFTVTETGQNSFHFLGNTLR
jgi:hypothetical protein